MGKSINDIIEGHSTFKKKYGTGEDSTMEKLAHHGQKPEIMVIACCDSRVDPTLILQCEPGDLFTVRNVANIVPPYEADEKHHGTSAALEFGICGLDTKHLIILGHSQCGGMKAWFDNIDSKKDDFVTRWVSTKDIDLSNIKDPDELAKKSLIHSYENCLTFPWIAERVKQKTLSIHLWFFDIKDSEITTYSFEKEQFEPLE